MAGSQKITLWGPQRTTLGILRVNGNNLSEICPNMILALNILITIPGYDRAIVVRTEIRKRTI